MKKIKMKMKRVISFVLTMILVFSPAGYAGVEEVYAADSKVESAISWAIAIANDNSHGYSQSVRWGPHYDCSSFVYSAFYQAGFRLPYRSGYTQTMVNDFTKAGFKWIPWSQIGGRNNLQRGDILLNNSSNSAKQHTEIYLGSGQNVGAHSPSKGISVSGYYEHPWLGVLRYGGSSNPAPSVSFTQDSKYNAVKGFKGYTLSTGKVELLEANLSSRIGYIYATDECTVHELYTNGWCRVTCPWSDGGTRTGYARISNFIQSPAAAIGNYTASTYINLYSKPGLGTQIYRIYPNDVCLTIGSSGSATQVFMPVSGKGYYELGWAKLPSVTPSNLTKNTQYPTPFKCRILSNSNSVVCAYRNVNDASSYVGHVYVNDDCMIQEVYTNGWCKFTCPFYGTTETVYGKFSDFSSCNISPYSLGAPKYAKTYYKSDKAAEVGWIDPGDAVTVIAVQGNMSQIVYPADVGKRCGWVDSSALVDSYTVSYDANGGSGALPPSQTANKGTEITLSSTVLTRIGYTFAGWTDLAGNVLYASGSKYFGNANIKLYAVWRKNEYDITYDANGGEQAPKAQTQLYGEAVTVSSSLCSGNQAILVENGIADSKEEDGITLERRFLSWNTKADGSGLTVQAGEKYTPNANVTLYAQYGKASFTPSTLPVPPERTGYTFVGWYDSRNRDKKIEAGQELDTDLNGIYARWTANSYTVSYDAGGGSGAPESQVKIFGEALKLSETRPQRAGYTFRGWGLSAESREVAYESGSEYRENASITLYAVWDEVNSELISVTIVQEPAKKNYAFGEALNTEGLRLRLTYSSGNTKEVTSGYTVTGYDSRQAGRQTITVACGGKTANFEVTVKEQPNDEVAVVTISDVVGAAPGEQVEVNIQLTKNPGFSFMMLKLTYDKDALELVNAENKTSGNHLFMLDDVIMWDSAKDVAVGSATRETMGTVTFRIKPEITLEDGSAVSTIGINSLTCYNEEEQEVTVRANAGTISIDTVNYGDVNRDGSVDDKDVQAIREYIITQKGSEGFDVQAADVNGDGVIDGRDIIRLNQYLSDHTVKLGYDRNKVIGSNGEELFMDDVKISIKNISGVTNDILTMDIIMDENPGVAALSICTDYDNEYMELISVANGTVVDGSVAQDPKEKGLLVWTTDTVSTGRGTLATLTFRVADGTDAGDYPVSVYVADCYDKAEKNHYGASEISYVTVPVRAVAAEGITLNETALTLAGGDAAALEANVMPLDATDKTVTWKSSDKAVAAVSEDGQVRALKKGVAVITAAVSNAPGQTYSASCTVTVTSDAPVENIPLEEDPDKKGNGSGGQQTGNDKTDAISYRLSTETGSAKIAAGKKIRMQVTGSDGSRLNNNELTWKSGNKKVATVNAKGVVTLNKKSGGKKATITAVMKDGSNRQLKFTVHSMKGAVKSIRISGKKTVISGKSLKLKATVSTTKGTANKKLKWSSGNSRIAQVSSSGRVKTFKGKKGTVKITAAATDGSGKKKTVKIKIK